ncbi:MAG: hypothetical protein ABWX65_03925 [Mycetocola sp.]
MTAGTPKTEEPEAGMSLVELLIYSTLAIVVLTIVGSVLTAALRAENEVRSLSSTASLGQLVSRSVEEGVRNASGILADVEDANGQLLRARVAVGTAAGEVEWECQAWYYSPSTTSFYWATDETTAIPAPTTLDDLDGSPWILLGDGIHRADGADAFFGSDGSQVILRFKVSSDAVDLVLIPNTVVKRLPASGGTGPATCF